MKKYLNRICAPLLAIALLLPPLAPARGAETKIEVDSADALIQLAKSCKTDVWSQGVEVVLTADIDLTGSGFSPIPVFQGTFDGAGHKISGLNIASRGSDLGLFRYLQPQAVVKNLVLEGRAAPAGSRRGIGLLAGRNEGTISGCTVSGTVTGGEHIGGLVGVNTETGHIEGCSSEVQVTGEKNTGGIAGSNQGYIELCTNKAAVNDSNDPDAENVGGITGLNDGYLTSCVNYGSIGYSHAGYNVGGIAGLHRGSVDSCENHGPVQGRKDVGGIIGQMEPHTVFFYGKDPAQQLEEELNTLSRLMNRLVDQAHSSTAGGVTDLSAIHDTLGDLQQDVHDAGTDFNTHTNDTGKQAYDAVQAINSSMDALLNAASGYQDAASPTLDEIQSHLRQLQDALSDGTGAASWGSEAVQAAVQTAANQLEAAWNQAISHLNAISDDLQRLHGFLKDALPALAQNDLAGILEAFEHWQIGSIDPSAHLSGLSASINNMGTALSQLHQQLDGILHSASGGVDDALRQADAALSALDDAFSRLRGHTSNFGTAVTDRLKEVNLQVDVLEDVLHAYGSDLHTNGQLRLDELDDHLSTLRDQVDALNQGAADANHSLHAATSDILQQLDRVRAALKDLTEPPEKTIEDVSESDETPLGRVISCRSDAPISGDTNVGGIAGTLAPELSPDPEQDLDLNLQSEHLLVDTTAFLHAVIRHCENRGDISSKTGSAGGIMGRGEVGAILDCVSICSVEASSGSQCGGIAGMSRTVIRRCAAQTDLDGTDFLGGIVGQGRDVADCIAMASATGGEGLGAIAGSADGSVTNNFFLDEGLAGIDSVNYEGKAMPLDLESFSALASLPDDFLTLTIRFQVDGKTFQRVQVPYGGTLTPEQLPALPEREGQFGAWEDFDPNHITRSLVIDAIYTTPVRTLASEEGEPPVLLAQGVFAPEARLTLTPRTAELSTNGANVLGVWNYSVPAEGDVTLRLLAPEKNMRAALLQNNVLTPVHATRDGSYLVFSAAGQGTVVLLEDTTPSPLFLLIPAAAAGAVLVLLLLHRKKQDKGKAPQAETESTH